MTGRTAACVRARANLPRACAHWLPGRYYIEVSGLLEAPRMAVDDQIGAMPALVKAYPPPVRKIAGDFSGTGQLVFGMQLRPCGPAPM